MCVTHSIIELVFYIRDALFYSEKQNNILKYYNKCFL